MNEKSWQIGGEMSQKTLSVCKNTNGTVTVSDDRCTTVVDIRKLEPKERLEAVRWAVLMGGHVYTTKIERMVRKELGL